MFKHYLTYELGLSFERACRTLAFQNKEEEQNRVSPLEREQLLRSAQNFIHHFARSLRTRDRKEECRWLYTAIVCLRDVKELLQGLGYKPGQVAESAPVPESFNDELRTLLLRWEVLHGRLEQMIEKAAAGEHGQIRMLG